MADETMAKHAILNLEVRNSILKVDQDVNRERKIRQSKQCWQHFRCAGEFAATDLYSKGGSGDNYSKNTKLKSFDETRIKTINELTQKP